MNYNFYKAKNNGLILKFNFSIYNRLFGLSRQLTRQSLTVSKFLNFIIKQVVYHKIRNIWACAVQWFRTFVHALFNDSEHILKKIPNTFVTSTANKANFFYLFFRLNKWTKNWFLNNLKKFRKSCKSINFFFKIKKYKEKVKCVVRYGPSSPGKFALARAWPRAATARACPRATEAAGRRAGLPPPRAGGPPARPRATTPRPRPACKSKTTSALHTAHTPSQKKKHSQTLN